MLRREFPYRSSRDIAKKLKRTIISVYGAAHSLHLKKSKEFYLSKLSGRFHALTPSGIPFRFKKGQQSWNQGKTWDDFMSKKAQQRSRSTCFKKGNIPHNAIGKENGTITIRTDKDTGRKTKWIRLKLGKWQELHRYLWRKHKGKIPKGLCVAFKNNDSLNCVITNLELITREENMKRNSIFRYPPEMREAMRTLGRFKSKIHQHEKQNNRLAESPV